MRTSHETSRLAGNRSSRRRCGDPDAHDCVCRKRETRGPRVFFRDRQGSGKSRTLGCATFTPLKVVARRVREARALGATVRGARIATEATRAAMVCVCWVVVPNDRKRGAKELTGFWRQRLVAETPRGLKFPSVSHLFKTD